MQENVSIRSAIGWTLFIFFVLFEDSWTFTHNFNEIKNYIFHTIITVVINSFFLFVIPFFFSDYISRILKKKNYYQNRERVLRNSLLIICAFLFFLKANIIIFFEEKHLKEVYPDKFQLIDGFDKGSFFLLFTFGISCLILIRRK